MAGGLPQLVMSDSSLFKRIGDMARCEDGFLLYFKSNGVLEPTESMYHGWTEPGVEAVFHILYRRPGQVGVST